MPNGTGEFSDEFGDLHTLGPLCVGVSDELADDADGVNRPCGNDMSPELGVTADVLPVR